VVASTCGGGGAVAVTKVDQLRAAVIWGMLADGFTEEEIFRLFPDLTREELADLVSCFWLDLGSGE
jgi:uncharacterized protein (DUF433 family)